MRWRGYLSAKVFVMEDGRNGALGAVASIKANQDHVDALLSDIRPPVAHKVTL